jgi:uncharacterized protein (TIGR02118 family)
VDDLKKICAQLKDEREILMTYYCNTHMPMVRHKLGKACKRVEVEQGLAGGQPGEKPYYVALAHMLFDSVEAFQSAFGPHAEAIMADVPNYTDIAPTIQISQLRL